MSAKFVCSALVLLVLCVFSVKSYRIDDEKGTEHCSECKEAIFVRPNPPRFAYPNTELDLIPIGERCSCDKGLVETATQPKPCNKNPTLKLSSCKCASRSPPTGSKSCCDHHKPETRPSSTPTLCRCRSSPTVSCVTYENPKSNAIPADPLSISLALQANKATAVPEAKLAYGFANTPIDCLNKITSSNVPEEKLFEFNNNVITLKKSLLPPTSPSEEVEEWEEKEVREVVESPDTSKITYQQLGYSPEHFKNPKFRKISTYSRDDYYSHEAEAIPNKLRGDCACRPGHIAAHIKRKNKEDPVECC